jgi:hypothetical protein
LGRLEAIWKITQIAAVLVGGYWTWLVFVRTEAPLLEVNATIERSLSAPVRHATGCLQTFTVTLVNTGKTAFTAKSVVTRGWKFYMPKNSDVFAELMDLDRIKMERPLFEKRFPDAAALGTASWYPFLRRYRAGERYSHDFVVYLKKEAGAWFYLETEIVLKGEAIPQVSGMWDRVCREA